jgi:excisionase family DNA binding protein
VPDPAPTRLLTVDDLADCFQVSAKTVRRWREEQRLPKALEVGGVIRWRPEDLDTWIQEQTR